VPQTARIKAAVLNQKIAQTNTETYSQFLANQLEIMLGEYGKDKSSLEYYETSALPQAKLIISQSSASYKAGAMNYSDYIQSLNSALQIKENYLDVMYHYNQSIIAIETILGKGINSK
jgi:cobalt-zinc-cadmium resistance protein CzcA